MPATLKSSLRTGTPIDLQYRVSSDEKTWIWMRSRGAARRDASGTIVRWYGSVESIDDYKRALDELRCSEARLRAIFDAAQGEGIVLVESQTRKVLSANPRAERLIGFQFKAGIVWSANGWKAFDSCGQPIDGSNLPLMRAVRLRRPSMRKRCSYTGRTPRQQNRSPGTRSAWCASPRGQIALPVDPRCTRG